MDKYIRRKSGDRQYECSLCRIAVSGDYRAHLRGDRHRKALAISGVEEKVSDYISQLSGKDQYRCDLCRLNISGNPSLDQHLASARHVARTVEEGSSATAAATAGEKEGMGDAADFYDRMKGLSLQEDFVHINGDPLIEVGRLIQGCHWKKIRPAAAAGVISYELNLCGCVVMGSGKTDEGARRDAAERLLAILAPESGAAPGGATVC